MSKWKYLKGSEKDFEGAHAGATHKYVHKECKHPVYTANPEIIKDVLFDLVALREPITNVTVNISAPCGEDDFNDCIGAPESRGKRKKQDLRARGGYIYGPNNEPFLPEGYPYLGHTNCRCKSSDMTIQGIPLNEINGTETVTYNKYLREIKPGVWVDVYDVLMAWAVTNPALQHLIKKALQTGGRGHKTREQDLQDIIDSAIRAKELEQ